MSTRARAIRYEAAPWPGLLELTKPRLSSLVLFTTVVGYAAGAPGALDPARLLVTLIGTALVAGGANALNQIVERDRDALMERTKSRPLPTGRVGVTAAMRFAVAISVLGFAVLLAGTNLLTAFLGALALALYVLVYTPLKTITVHNTLVGAVVGALPPLMGWTAAAGAVSAGGWALFAILFVWQLPHFFSIAWLYREDYARGGYRMLSVVDETGRITRFQVPVLATLLVPVSLMPAVLGMTGRLYFHAALALGLVFLTMCVWRTPRRQRELARRSFLASVVYLPALLTVYLVDKL